MSNTPESTAPITVNDLAKTFAVNASATREDTEDSPQAEQPVVSPKKITKPVTPTAEEPEEDFAEPDETPESDEEEEGEQEPEEEQPEEDSEPDESDDKEFYLKVKDQDGKEIEIPASEAAKGYMRQSDYTKKLQEVSKKREEVTHLEKDTAQRREFYVQGIDVLASLIQTSSPQKPSLDLLDVNSPKYNPDEFHRQDYVWREAASREAQLKQAREHALKDREVDRQKTLASTKERLTESVPEWRQDESKAAQEITSIYNYAHQSLGFPLEQLQEAIYDPRNTITLRKAYLYDRMMSNKAKVEKKVEGKPNVVPMSSGKTKTAPASPNKDLETRFKKTGSVKDLAELFAANAAKKRSTGKIV